MEVVALGQKDKVILTWQGAVVVLMSDSCRRGQQGAFLTQMLA
jgi:hypothetical protein